MNLDVFKRAVLDEVNNMLPIRENGFFYTVVVNLYVCPLYAFMWRKEAGVPRSLKRCSSWWKPSGLPTWKLIIKVNSLYQNI